MKWLGLALHKELRDNASVEGGNKVIEQLLKEENCIVRQNVKDWKEAIHISLEPLVQQGFCTDQYEQAVLENTEKFGAYYVLTDDMALIHASSEAGVKETQMAVTVLKEPVYFTEDGAAVRILIALVAKDQTSHMDGIVAVSTIFGDEGNVQPILDATSGKEIFDSFVEASKE